MTSPRGKILVELARIAERYGVDEVLALARAMRDPGALNDLAALLEHVAEATRTNKPQKSRARSRTKSLPQNLSPPLGTTKSDSKQRGQARSGKANARRRAAFRTALYEGYTTLESLGGLLDRLGLDRQKLSTVEDAHQAILRRLNSVGDAERIENDIIDGATRPGGELDKLTQAIVSKGNR